MADNKSKCHHKTSQSMAAEDKNLKMRLHPETGKSSNVSLTAQKLTAAEASADS